MFQLGIDQQQLGARVLENPRQLTRSQACVQHDEDGPDPHRREVRFQRHRAVGSEHRDAVAGQHPERHERARLPRDAVLEFRVGKAAITIDDGDHVAPCPGAARKKIEWSERSDHGDDCTPVITYPPLRSTGS